MAEKRFQVFISSTFDDLIEERQSVLKAVLELNHMPAGMELFPASDDTAWDLIKDVIDASDYYVVVIAGRYGSLDEEGLSYTEKEYEYAYSQDKPIIPLLYKDPNNLPREKTETKDKAWKKLQGFRQKVETTHACKYWRTAEDLKAKVIVSLTSEIKKRPGIGWIRANQVSNETRSTILDLKDQIQELETKLEKNKTLTPKGIDGLKQGNDIVELKVTFNAHPLEGSILDQKTYESSIKPTWNEIFSSISPILINETSEIKLKDFLKEYLKEISMKEFKSYDQFKEFRLMKFEFDESQIDTCLVQLRALGLIEESIKKRSVKDTSTYWTLTNHGDNLMVKLRALKKEPDQPRSISGKTEQANA